MSEVRNFIRFFTFLVLIIAALVIAGLLLSSTCKAQQYDPNKTLTVFKFMGLQTSGGTFGTTPDYSAVSVNVDYSRHGQNTAGLRYGFDSVKTISGIDSLVGLGTYQRSNRQSCLVYAVDDSTKGYGAIWATLYGSDNPDSARKIKDYWSIQNPTRFSQFNDRLYAANGQQQGIVWDGTRSRNFPVNTPGMPDMIPLNTSGNLNGEYRYCIYQALAFNGGNSYTFLSGSLSPPVNVKNGRVLFRNFTRAIYDTMYASVDSAYCYLGRTKANPGPIDDNDTIWLVSPKIYLKIGASYTADTVTYTDTAQDTGLSNSIAPGTFRTAFGRDSTKIITGRRFGAPTFLLADSVTAGSNVIYPGSLTGAYNILGYAYVVTSADTTLGLESDTTRSLWVRTRKLTAADSTKTLHRITIGLPRLGAYDSGYVFNIYRASLNIFGRKYIAITSNGDTIWADSPPGGPSIIRKGGEGMRIDSVKALDWYRCAQVPSSQTTYVDSIRTDSLYVQNRRFNLSTQPEIFSQMFQWRGKLGGVAGSRIWWSSQYVDSQGNFGANSFDDFNRNDGDFNTAVGEAQFGLKVKKNRASYVVPNNGGRPEKVSNFGCVAPLSFISTDVGDLFVGDGGVYLETEGQQLERVYNAGLVSEKLNNFVNMPDSVRRTITGHWLPDRRQAIFSADFPATSNDTAYVLDFKSGQTWTTWTNLVPKFGVLYSKNSTLGSPPPQTFYFTKAGSKVLYKYGTANYDVYFDSLPNMTYETALLFSDPDYEQIDAIGVVTNSFVADEDYINARVYDQRWYKTSSVITLDSLAAVENGSYSSTYGIGYRMKDVDGPVCRGSRIRLYSGTSNNQMIGGAIEGLYVFYRTVERASGK